MADREQEQLLTAEGVKRLEDELEHLKSVRRREVAERIKVAREFGDLSENSEYEEAKNEQAWVEGRIAYLESTLRNARIVGDEDVDPERVSLNSVVVLKDEEAGDEMTVRIVGSTEADPGQMRISYQSPVGQAVFGRRAGETVEVKLPAGVARYTILKVER
ncbi:MAG: transcription elongation factor GreA [Dactylosporangium sp.]|nr:transcription elongation factor GreA [Dactylosporangium sp.]